MALVLLFGPVLLPEHRPSESGRLDPGSVLLSLAAMLPAIYGFKELIHSGPSALSVSALAIGSLCGVLFVRRQRGMSDPLLAAIYQARMTGAPPEAAESLTGAARLADQLPEQAGNTLLSMARDAFTGGINTVGLVCAVLLVMLAVIAIILQPPDHGQPSTDPALSPSEAET